MKKYTTEDRYTPNGTLVVLEVEGEMHEHEYRDPIFDAQTRDGRRMGFSSRHCFETPKEVVAERLSFLDAEEEQVRQELFKAQMELEQVLRKRRRLEAGEFEIR